MTRQLPQQRQGHQNNSSSFNLLFHSFSQGSRFGFHPAGESTIHEHESPPAERSLTMRVEMRPIGTVRPYENNPRQNDAGVDAVAASIRAFGFRQPIVVDKEGVIIVGHTRYKAALRLGLEIVPVHIAKDL